jgi:hypothetical protein
MATSGTTAYNPAASNLTLTAFGRIGIRRTEITAQHLADAEVEANLVQVKLANLQPNLWTTELISTTLIESTATYTMPANIIALQAVYITTDDGSTATDRVVWPYSTFEYAAIPNKTQEGSPTSYWYNRLSTPEISLWPVPDDAATYTLNIRAVAQIQDVSLKSGANLDLPYRWLDVYVADLAHRLSRIYATPLEAARKADAAEAWANAATEDQERVPIFINAAIGSYYR